MYDLIDKSSTRSVEKSVRDVNYKVIENLVFPQKRYTSQLLAISNTRQNETLMQTRNWLRVKSLFIKKKKKHLVIVYMI